ncbi:hypothetical protein ABIB17_003603 [Arthrobacter sp. UYEF6]
MTASLKAFWWAPYLSTKLAKPELRWSSSAWTRLALRTGRPLRNFGDVFSATALQYATGQKVTWVQAQRAEVFAVGSILEFALRESKTGNIWGTGLRGPLSSLLRQRLDDSDLKFHAVRGPLTAKELGLDGLALGDPGLLIQQILPKQVLQGADPVYIPHFREWATARGRAYISKMEQIGYSTVYPSSRPLKIANLIQRSSHVVSSSLHGIVFAHSLGRPVVAIEPEGGESAFKFRDHYGSLSLDFNAVKIEDIVARRAIGNFLTEAQSNVDPARRRASLLIDGLLRSADGIR